MKLMFALAVGSMGLGTAFGVDAPSTAFTQRLNDYVKIRTQAITQVSAATKNTTPTDIAQHESALAAAIQKARAGVQPGNIFTPEVTAMFEKLLRTSLTGPDSADRRASIKEGNPRIEKAPGQVDPVIQVSAVYPKSAPLSTVPPSLLMKLPALPKDIEYRFVGRTLILRDSQSNLIVDFLRQAVPVP